MATKKQTSAIDEARKTVKDFDDSQRTTTDNATDVCGCNASSLPHRHLDRGIIDNKPE